MPCEIYYVCSVMLQSMLALCIAMWVRSWVEHARRALQVAKLVNTITHLQAGKVSSWPQLDDLHGRLHARLDALAQDVHTSWGTRRHDVHTSLQQLLAPSATQSASARTYYLKRAAANAAPASCTLLFLVAAAAHCDGNCSSCRR